MRWQDGRNGFDFNDQLPIHEKVRAKPFVELHTLVGNRNPGLPFKGDPRLLQRMTQAAFIRRFQHARTCDPVHLDGQPDDSAVNSRASSIQPCLRAAPWFFVISVLKA